MMIKYDNWFIPTMADLHFEWESEWDKMRFFLNTSYFDDATRMVELIQRFGKAKRLPKSADRKLRRRTHCSSVEQVEDMVASYRSAARRKGVPTALAAAFEEGKPLPMPLVMQRYQTGYIVGGNTRLNIAEILDVQPDPKVFYINLDTPDIQDLLEEYPLRRL